MSLHVKCPSCAVSYVSAGFGWDLNGVPMKFFVKHGGDCSSND